MKSRISWVAVIGGALVGAPALAARQTGAVEGATQEAQKAGETARQAEEAAETEAKQAGEAMKQQTEKATEEIDRAAEKSKEQIDAEAEKARKGVEEEAAKAEQAMSSDEMEDKLEAKLAKDKQLRGSKIEVDMEDEGTVKLEGSVPTEKARARAVQLASTTKGVKQVKDELRVETVNP